MALGGGHTNPIDFLQAVLAALIFRYTNTARVHIEVRSDQRRINEFDLAGDSTANSLMGSDRRETTKSHPVVQAAIAVGDGYPGESAAEMTLSVRATSPESTDVDFSFQSGVCSQESANRLVRHFGYLAQAMSENPSACISQINILSESEIETILVGWNNTTSHVTEYQCLHDAFEAQADERPNDIAVIHGDKMWSFGEINGFANRLANHLIGIGVGPDVRVGVCLDQSPEFLISIIGIMKAGGAYVPLDPEYPYDRLKQMIDGVECKAMITCERVAAKNSFLHGVTQQIFLIDTLMRSGVSADLVDNLDNPIGGATADNLCYVIHTSGSTGSPKPIALCHGGVLNNLADLNSRFDVGPGDALLALSSTSFDMSVYEFLGMALAGGTVVVPDDDGGYHPATWVRLLRHHQITVWNSAPPLVELLLDYLETTNDTEPLPVRLCMTGGDWVPSTLPKRFRKSAPDLRFVAVGGATEASVSSTFFEAPISAVPTRAHLPLGQPLANQRTYILDQQMLPVPIGIAGELCLAGKGLARGYLDCPEATAERFIEWSFSGEPPERIYRTGDMARFMPDGVIEMLGRKDFQVKIGGRRIELGEIETTLANHPDVKHAVVLAIRNSSNAGSLIGYVIPNRPQVSINTLLETLREKLPKYMIPTTIELLDSFPLTPNGKVDRNALSTSGGLEKLAVAHETTADWESIVVTAWEDVLGVEMTADDNFFDGGGDSISAIKSLARIDGRIKLADIYRNPTPAALSSYLLKKYGQPATGLTV
jgi:amino acid adenylation domain-containing protein